MRWMPTSAHPAAVHRDRSAAVSDGPRAAEPERGDGPTEDHEEGAILEETAVTPGRLGEALSRIARALALSRIVVKYVLFGARLWAQTCQANLGPMPRQAAPGGCMRAVASAALLIGILAPLLSAHGQGPTREIPPELILERFSVSKDGDALLVPVRVAQNNLLFLADTGVAVTCFDTSIPLGQPIGVYTANGVEGTSRSSSIIHPRRVSAGYRLAPSNASRAWISTRCESPSVTTSGGSWGWTSLANTSSTLTSRMANCSS